MIARYPEGDRVAEAHFHLRNLRAHERKMRAAIKAGAAPAEHWRHRFIEGHAARAVATALQALAGAS